MLLKIQYLDIITYTVILNKNLQDTRTDHSKDCFKRSFQVRLNLEEDIKYVNILLDGRESF